MNCSRRMRETLTSEFLSKIWWSEQNATIDDSARKNKSLKGREIERRMEWGNRGGEDIEAEKEAVRDEIKE